VFSKSGMSWRCVVYASQHHLISIPSINSQLNKSRLNIMKARERLIACLDNQGPPREGQPLHSWHSDMKRYGQGGGVAAINFESHQKNTQPTLAVPVVYILRHIMYMHNLPLPSILTLWALFMCSLCENNSSRIISSCRPLSAIMSSSFITPRMLLRTIS